MENVSSPGLSGSPGAEFLTPRSKVARMLADIDDEIENAPTPSPSNKSAVELLDHGSTINTSVVSLPKDSLHVNQKLSNSNSHAEEEHASAASESDGSEDMVRRPQGRAARRMLGNKKEPTRTSPSSVQIRSPSPQNPPDSQDYEDDLYSATPLRQPRRARTVSPSPIAAEKGNGLFVSPTKSVDADSEDELPSNPFGTKDKLAELVAQKRAERLAKGSEEKDREKTTSSVSPTSDLPDEAFEGPQEPADPNIERIMSDATRPSRKASKKALLEMERETQRMARQQALAHQMKVKKKFTTNDLFTKFNYRRVNDVSNIPAEQLGGDATASSVPNSDGVEEKTRGPPSTPPSTPPTPLDRQKELVDQGALSKLVPAREDSLASLAQLDDDEELPEIMEMLKSSQPETKTQAAQTVEIRQDRKGLKFARLGNKAIPQYDSSDEELDIIPNLPSHLRAFGRIATSKRSGSSSESRAIHNLRHLSHLHADDGPQHKKGSKQSISAKALESQLRKQAKEQARKQQLERIEELKAKGIEVQTTEEREREAETFENLLEKARQDAAELRKAEKAGRKGADGEDDVQISDDEDEDADYDGSGSEDEDVEDGDGDGENEQDDGGLVDEAAKESEDEGEELEGSDEEPEADDEAEPLVEEDNGVMEADSEEANNATEITRPAAGARKPRKSRIVIEDEDDVDLGSNNFVAEPEEIDPEDDPFAAFGFGAASKGNFLMSPTQAFHATMETPTQASQEDSFDILRRIAPPSASSLPPSLPDIDTPNDDETQLNFIAGSQVPESQRINLNWETQAPETPAPAKLIRDASALSETPGWEPTQDEGLPSPWSIKPRKKSTLDSEDEHDTQSTLRMRISESPAPSQTAPRRGRLVRRQAPLADNSEDEDIILPASVRPKEKDAFREMARCRKEALTEAERAQADKEMREMMDEQAEESEDEYAGLGGDDFVAPETEQDKEMIDSSQVDVDERALAAHYAERERIRNETETSKLYKDLTTGVLRRKMGANAFDLEEDEDELAARRRQMRQQEEAKKRKALLKDVNIATLADGKQSKGKDAFLKAIADDDGDEDLINISDGEDGSAPATQVEIQVSQSQEPADEPLRETSGNKRRVPSDEEDGESRPPYKQRRIQASAFKRPTSLIEVKESVSFLLEEPNAGTTFAPTALELSSDSEEASGTEEPDEAEEDDFVSAEAARQNDGGFAPNPASMDAKIMPPPRLPASQRRTALKPAVVDRLSLKRVSSATESAHGRTAWVAGPTTGGFKVPSLLRRATTSITSGANDRGVTTPSLSRESSGVKMGGTKKSSLAYQARAEERKAIVEASAKRREENTARIAQLRRNSSALNRGLTGRFE